MIDKIDAQSAKLARNSMLGRARPELWENLRSFPVSNCVLFYRPEPGGIELVRVLHGARDLLQQLPDTDG